MNDHSYHETKLNKAHKWFCRVEWCLWIIGIVLLLVRWVTFPEDYPAGYTEDFARFDNIVCDIAVILFVLSSLPVEPVLFVGSLVSNIRHKASICVCILDVVRFLITVVLWGVFVCTFVATTGGV